LRYTQIEVTEPPDIHSIIFQEKNMFKRISLSLMLALLIVSLLAACGGGGAPTPVTYSQLPVFTGATESANEQLVGMVEALLLQVRAETTIKSTEGKAYDVPEGTTWDAVKSFYTAALEKAGWVQAKMTDANLGYARGNQAVNVLYVEGAGLVVVLSEAK
jgi:hypothetical protein